MLDFYVKTSIRLSLRDKRLFEITEVEITRVDCIFAIEILVNKRCRLCSVASDLGTHCLHMSPKGISSL